MLGNIGSALAQYRHIFWAFWAYEAHHQTKAGLYLVIYPPAGPAIWSPTTIRGPSWFTAPSSSFFHVLAYSPLFSNPLPLLKEINYLRSEVLSSTCKQRQDISVADIQSHIAYPVSMSHHLWPMNISRGSLDETHCCIVLLGQYFLGLLASYAWAAHAEARAQPSQCSKK